MERAYHQEVEGPMVLERISDLKEARERLGDFHDIRGMAVVNPKGDEVGRVHNLYIDPKLDKLTMASITFGGVWGFGARQVLVPVDHLEVVDGDRIRIMPSPEIVNAAPEFKAGEGDYRCYCDYWTRVSEKRLNESHREAP